MKTSVKTSVGNANRKRLGVLGDKMSGWSGSGLMSVRAPKE